MKYYLGLQYKMLHRSMADAGIAPAAAYIFITILFTCLSLYFFKTVNYAKYVYIFFALSFITSLGESERNSFLKSCFSKPVYYKIRIAENLLLATPFIIFMLFKNCFLPSVILIITSIIAVFSRFSVNTRFSIPTPFYKQPFEFITGFRKFFWVFIAFYALTFISIWVGNFYLGLFALVVIFLMCLSFFTITEKPYYVWIYSLNARQFLLKKIKTSLLQSTLLCLPVTTFLIIFFPGNTYFILAAYALGCIYMVTVIMAKYAAFPDKINILQTIMIAFSIWFIPLLLIIAPYFYIQALNKLNTILNDNN